MGMKMGKLTGKPPLQLCPIQSCPLDLTEWMMVSESANGVGVLAASYDASEVGGGVFGEGGDDLTEEERETVSHVVSNILIISPALQSYYYPYKSNIYYV